MSGHARYARRHAIRVSIETIEIAALALAALYGIRLWKYIGTSSEHCCYTYYWLLNIIGDVVGHWSLTCSMAPYGIRWRRDIAVDYWQAFGQYYVTGIGQPKRNIRRRLPSVRCGDDAREY